MNKAEINRQCREYLNSSNRIVCDEELQERAKMRLSKSAQNQFDDILDFLVKKEIRRSEITLRLETDHPLNEHEINSLFIDIHRSGNNKIKKQDFDILITSNEIPVYNPLKEFFAANESRRPKGQIEALVRSLDSDMGLNEENHFYPEYNYTFLKKWLVGMVASIWEGNYNPLMVVLIGPKNTGKTEFFRRLLPDQLKLYAIQSKLDQGKDSEAQMVEYLMVLNDELDNFNGREAKAFRNFISAGSYNYRAPYGKQNITRPRLASVCGTSNDTQIIQDFENNRRIIPIEISQVDYDAYNSIDKELLLMEAYHLFKSGFDWDLTPDEISMLEECSEDYKITSDEEELIKKYFHVPQSGGVVSRWSATDVKVFLEKATSQRLSSIRIGKALRALGFEQKRHGNDRKWRLEEIPDTAQELHYN